MQRLGRLRDADNGSRWRNPERSLGFKPNGRMGPPLGASLPMRMTASWFGSSDLPNTRLWRD